MLIQKSTGMVPLFLRFYIFPSRLKWSSGYMGAVTFEYQLMRNQHFPLILIESKSISKGMFFR